MKFILWTNLASGSRNEQSTNAFHPSELVAKQANPKRQRFSESPHRKLWKMAETVFARIEVLEHLDQDHSHGERLRSGSPDNITSLPKEEVNRSLYKTLETALTRISVLEKRRDISYDHAFKASNGKQCMIRGCGSELSRPNHAIRHINNTSTPEHQVAAIILEQKECLECDKSWKTPSGLIFHEKKVHKETYTSRMDIFKQFLGQSSCMHFSSSFYEILLMNCRFDTRESFNAAITVWNRQSITRWPQSNATKLV